MTFIYISQLYHFLSPANIQTMNLFVLAQLAVDAAKYHCDKHCIKMILEICQLLYTAHWYNSETPDFPPSPELLVKYGKDDPYRMTHKNHPVAVWVRAKKAHYDYTVKLGLELSKDYSRRFGKIHRCHYHLQRLKYMGYPLHRVPETYKAPPHKRATVGLPVGVDYFDVCIADKDGLFERCARYDADGNLNCVDSYRAYYHTKEWDLKWNRGKDLTPVWYTKVYVPVPKVDKKRKASESKLPTKKIKIS